MWSKLWRPTYRLATQIVPVIRPRALPQLIHVRRHFIPPSQYDHPIGRRLNLGYALRVHWEIIPLFITTCVSLTILAAAILWASRNKVDVTFSTRTRDCISRTMDLRNPTEHKMIIINKHQEPWPEMQAVLDKMRDAQRRANMRAESCART